MSQLLHTFKARAERAVQKVKAQAKSILPGPDIIDEAVYLTVLGNNLAKAEYLKYIPTTSTKAQSKTIGWSTKISKFTFTPWEGEGKPQQYTLHITSFDDDETFNRMALRSSRKDNEGIIILLSSSTCSSKDQLKKTVSEIMSQRSNARVFLIFISDQVISEAHKVQQTFVSNDLTCLKNVGAVAMNLNTCIYIMMKIDNEWVNQNLTEIVTTCFGKSLWGTVVKNNHIEFLQDFSDLESQLARIVQFQSFLN